MRVVSVSLFLLLFLFSYSWAEKVFYSVQVASVTDFGAAEKVFKRVEKFPFSRVDYVDGRYKVRVGCFDDYDTAKEFFSKENLGKLFKGAYITRIYNTGYINTVLGQPVSLCWAENETEQVEGISGNDSLIGSSNSSNATYEEISSDFQGLESVNAAGNYTKEYSQSEESSSVSEEEKIGKVEEVVKVNFNEVNNKNNILEKKKGFDLKLFVVLLLLPVLSFFIFVLKRAGSKENKVIERDFHQHISELYSSGKFKELIDTASLYLLKVPEDTFVRELYAESLKELGRNLEAAEAYFELSKIFDDMKDLELSEKFRIKGEDLIDKEFGG